jgi:hypothetical protein
MVIVTCCSRNEEPANSRKSRGAAVTGNRPVASTATGSRASPRVLQESNQADRE